MTEKNYIRLTLEVFDSEGVRQLSGCAASFQEGESNEDVYTKILLLTDALNRHEHTKRVVDCTVIEEE
jgi:hypothetical protein